MNQLITARKVNPFKALIGFVLLGGSFILMTTYSSKFLAVVSPYLLMVTGLLAFFLVFDLAGLKTLFSLPKDPKGNIRNFFLYFFMALIIGFLSGIILQVVLGFKLTANPATEEFLSLVPKIPFMLLGEELISFYCLIICANWIYRKTSNKKQAEWIGIIFSSVIFGLLHYTTYFNGNMGETLAHILLIQGSARIAFNLSGLKSNSIVLPLIIHIVYDLIFLSIGSM